jgi:hypothetical protein
MSILKDEVRRLMGEATSHHNDGWVMAGAKEELTEIYNMIQKFLNTDARDISADKDKWIYESPDGGKTIYRRKFGDDKKEKTDKWKDVDLNTGGKGFTAEHTKMWMDGVKTKDK